MADTMNRKLFRFTDGKPMKFYIKPCPTKGKVRPLIEVKMMHDVMIAIGMPAIFLSIINTVMQSLLQCTVAVMSDNLL